MATAGPGRVFGVDMASGTSGWALQCRDCHEVLAEGTSGDSSTSQAVKEAVAAHICPGRAGEKQTGRITED